MQLSSRRTVAVLLAAIATLSLALAARAEALVYWVNNGSDTIGRANLDGTGVDQSFITVTGSVPPSYGVAVTGKHVFWASASGWIGRARLDGTGVDAKFIPTAPGGGDGEVALDDRHIFWTNGSTGWIGRARLDGKGVDQQLLAPQSNNVRGLAVGGGFIYWADYQNSRIGNGGLSTLGVNPLFINPTADFPEGVTVDDAYVYWSNGSYDTIGRARLNGTGVDQSFIATAYAYGVEVNDRHLFWANYDTNSIGRAKLSGAAPDPGFISGADGPEGVALDWIANVGARFRIAKTKINASRGTAKLTVEVPGPGTLILEGRGLERVRKSVNQARVGLQARPKGGLKRELAEEGKAEARVRITFSPMLSNGSKTKAKDLLLRKARPQRG